MKLRFSVRASREIANILHQLSQRSPRAASKFSRRVGAVLNKIADFPLSGHTTSSQNIRAANTAPYPYLIFYEVKPSTVDIVAIVHGARKPATMPAQLR